MPNNRSLLVLILRNNSNIIVKKMLKAMIIQVMKGNFRLLRALELGMMRISRLQFMKDYIKRPKIRL